MERKVYGPRQRRHGRLDQLRKHGGSTFPRVRGHFDRYRAPGYITGRKLCARPSGESDRLRLPRGSRNDPQGKAHDCGLLRPGAKFSYWNGCSTGGRQALVEAQRFPADYNGIVSGAPAIFLTHMQAASVWKAQAIRKNPGGLVPPSKLLLIHNAVLAACDARDGMKDGLLQDPRLCNFDPNIMQCKGEDHPDCLTAAQVVVVRAFYSPTVNPRTREQIFPGWFRGANWAGVPTRAGCMPTHRTLRSPSRPHT